MGTQKSAPWAGILSDTHGLMRPEAVEKLKGAALIIHAGDVGSPEVLKQLRTLAPTFAVSGNNDKGDWADQLPARELVRFGPISIYVLHDLNEIDLDPAAAGFHAVVSGHSHRPSITQRGAVLYMNPGSAGPRRFKLPISMGRIRIEDGAAAGQIFDLTVPVHRNRE